MLLIIEESWAKQQNKNQIETDKNARNPGFCTVFKKPPSNKNQKNISLLKDKSFVTGLFLVLSKFAVNDNFPY